MHRVTSSAWNPDKTRPRNDVLDLYNSCMKPDGKHAELAITRLAALGYHETHPEPEYWVLSRAGVKVHIYSALELSAFAIHVGAVDVPSSAWADGQQSLEEIS